MKRFEGEDTINNQYSPIKYKYKVYGLTIESDFQWDELVPSYEPPDVQIVNGKVPHKIKSPYKKGPYFQASQSEFLFQVQDVAKYYVCDGNKIIVEPYEKADLASIKLYILGTGFGSLLFQRRVLPIHGSAVVVEGNCIILSGVSGAGKSTLSLALRKKGYTFLTDDIAVLDLREDGTIWVHPGFPQQKLNQDSANIAEIDIASLTKVNPSINKYYVPVESGFIYKPIQLNAFCEIIPTDCQHISIRKVEGIQKLVALMNHTYRGELIPYLKIKQQHFEQCSFVARQINIYQMVRPNNKFTTEEQVEVIKNQLSRMNN